MMPGGWMRRVCPGVFCALFAGALSVADERTVIVDVLEISGKTVPEVADTLGEPGQCIDTYQGNSCHYEGGVEITYINGRADWIQVSPTEEIPFEPNALRYIGLLPTLPLVRNPFRMHWDGHQGLTVVSLYASGRYVALFQVRAFTPR